MAVDSHILIIGAGLAGLGMGAQLKRLLGHNNFTIYDKCDDVGGTWAQNTYPNLSCDVPSEVSYDTFPASCQTPSKSPLTQRHVVLFIFILPKPRLVREIRLAARDPCLPARLCPSFRARTPSPSAHGMSFSSLVFQIIAMDCSFQRPRQKP